MVLLTPSICGSCFHVLDLTYVHTISLSHVPLKHDQLWQWVSPNPVFWPGGRTTSIFKGKNLVSVSLSFLKPQFRMEALSRPGESPGFPLHSSKAVSTWVTQLGPISALVPSICWNKSGFEAFQCLEHGRGSSEGRGLSFPFPACWKLFQSISFTRCLCPADSTAKTEISSMTLFVQIIGSKHFTSY